MNDPCNKFDLMYLVNPNILDKVQPHQETTKEYKEDLKFYRKRIFALTKDYLKGHKKDKDLDKIFFEYSSACIEYFKFIDKSEIIQESYKNLETKPKCEKVDKQAVNKSNEFIFNKKKPPAPRITDHIKIKSTKTNKKIVIPRERKINLKNERFKNKI